MERPSPLIQAIVITMKFQRRQNASPA